MAVGAGMFHSETPTPELFECGGRIHIFQLWGETFLCGRTAVAHKRKDT